MKFKKLRNRTVALLLCASVGIQAYLPVKAAAQGDDCTDHHLHYKGAEEVTEHNDEPCTHCAICVSCTDDVGYAYTKETYYCESCKTYAYHYYGRHEISRTCNCSNSSCCY